jgi:site-specific recombinase XerC
MPDGNFLKIRATYYDLHNKKYGKKYYVVRIGKKYDSKSYKTKSFKEGEETERDLYIQNWNDALEKGDSSTLGMLSAIQLAKLNLCLKKLEGTGIELETCVDFYLKHNNTVNAQTKFLEAIDYWEKLRTERGDLPRSISDAKLTTLRPFSKFVKNRPIGSITKTEVRNFLFSKTSWSINTKKLHRRNLSAFFNLLRKNGFANLNPASEIELPKTAAKEKVFYQPWEVWLYLDTCLQNKKFSLLGGAAIAAFFGGRLRETTRVSWDQVDFDSKRITYFAAQAKTRTRRILYRTKVGFSWIQLAKEKNKKSNITSLHASEKIAPKIKKAISRWVKLKWPNSSNNEYFRKWHQEALDHQNYLRQAFEAHAYIKFNYDIKTLSEVSGNSEETIKQSYNGIVKHDDNATAYFNLYPREAFTEGLKLAKDLEIVGDKELGNYEKKGWCLAAKEISGDVVIKVFKPEIKVGQLARGFTSECSDEEFKRLCGDDFFETVINSLDDLLNLGNSYQEKIVKLHSFIRNYWFDPTDEGEFGDVLFTKKYLELNLGENIWAYRLTLDEKGHCSY